MKDINEEIGKKVFDYLDKYKGFPIYNDIALAIEFGCSISQIEDSELEKENMLNTKLDLLNTKLDNLGLLLQKKLNETRNNFNKISVKIDNLKN